MIFVWFLKEKKLVPENLFDKDYIDTILKKSDNNANYYNAILQNLFFATLNRKNDLRNFALDKGFNKNKSTYDMNSFFRYENLYLDENPLTIMQRFKTIPFINGGLFDCLDVKENDNEKQIIDGFSRNEKWQATMPDELFFENKNVDFNATLNEVYQTKTGKYEVKGLFEIFNEYKFTVEENTPLEVDVALDPYLLGEIFENLLAYYNPETGATARKGSGSFYTPQEIVNYMVSESLLAFLQPFSPNLTNFENLHNFKTDQKHQLVKALSEVKILDPACGSGAFPMGVLYKMVDILKTIDPENSIWKAVQHDKIIGDKIKDLENDKKAIENLSDKEVRTKATKAVEDRLLDLENNFNNEHHFDDYTRKLYIIRNSIYGVDIQDVAIQISKLRFFLSLIIDQKNENINPLPNLETKFVIANTLIGIELPKFKVMGEEDHSQDQVKHLKEELKAIREKHFYVTGRKEKQTLKKQDAAKRQEIANALADSMTSYKQEDIDKWNSEIAHQKQIILDAELMPDMVQEIIIKDLFGGESTTKVNYRKERIKEALAQIRITQTKLDSITTNTQAEQIRTQALRIADWDIYNQNAQAEWFDSDWMFGISDGFDIVIGNPPYVVIKKETYKNYDWNGDLYYLFFENSLNKLLKNNGILSFITPKFFLVNKNANLIRKYFLEEIDIISLVETNPFEDVVSENLISTLKKVKSISEVIKIFKEENGLFTFFNEVNKNYCLNNEFNEILTFLDNDSINVLNKISENTLKLNDISKSKRGAEISKNELLENVKGFEVLIGKDVHKFEINLTKSKISEKHKEFKRLKSYFEIQQMIYLRRVSSDLVCTVSSNNYAFSKNIYGIQPNVNFDKKYICSLLNSKCLNFYYKKRFSTKKEDVFPEIQTYLFEQLPIKQISLSAQQPFINLVDKILEGKKSGNPTQHWENEIDIMGYHLYELNYQEAKIIDKDLKEIDFNSIAQ